MKSGDFLWFSTSQLTDDGQDLPKNSPQKYTITLYDMKTWQPVDIEVPPDGPATTRRWSFFLKLTQYTSHIW